MKWHKNNHILCNLIYLFIQRSQACFWPSHNYLLAFIRVNIEIYNTTYLRRNLEKKTSDANMDCVFQYCVLPFCEYCGKNAKYEVMYVRAFVCVNACARVRMCACACVRIYIYICVCVCVCIYTYIHIYTYMHIYIYIYTYIHINIYTYIQIYKYTLYTLQ